MHSGICFVRPHYIARENGHKLLPPANEAWGKVICLQVCVCPRGVAWLGAGCLVLGGACSGGCLFRGVPGPRGVWSQGGAWSGGCLVERPHSLSPLERLLLQAVRILLECILVICNCASPHNNCLKICPLNLSDLQGNVWVKQVLLQFHFVGVREHPERSVTLWYHAPGRQWQRGVAMATAAGFLLAHAGYSRSAQWDPPDLVGRRTQWHTTHVCHSCQR